MEHVNYKDIGILLKLLPHPEHPKQNLSVVQVKNEFRDIHPCEFYSTAHEDVEGEYDSCRCYPMMTDELEIEDATRLVRPHKTAPYNLGKNILKEHLNVVDY